MSNEEYEKEHAASDWINEKSMKVNFI